MGLSLHAPISGLFDREEICGPNCGSTSCSLFTSPSSPARRYHRLQRRVAAALSHHRALASPDRRQRCACGSPARDLGLLRDDALLVGVLPSQFACRLCLRGILAHVRARPCISQPKAGAYGLVLGCAGGALLVLANGGRRSAAQPGLSRCSPSVRRSWSRCIITRSSFSCRCFSRKWCAGEPSGRAGLRHMGRHAAGAARSWIALRSVRDGPGLRGALLGPTVSRGRSRPSTSASCCRRSSSAGSLFALSRSCAGSSSYRREGMRKVTFALHEWTAIAALVLMPPVVIVVSMYTTHAFVERYLLWTVIGFALLGAAGLSAAVRGRAAVGVALIGIAIAAIARLEIGPLLETPVLRDSRRCAPRARQDGERWLRTDCRRQRPRVLGVVLLSRTRRFANASSSR